MKRLNILLVLDVFAFDTVGGGGEVFYEHAKGLVRKGHNVFVLFRRRNEKLPLQGIIDGIHFYTYDNNYRNTLAFMMSCILNTSKLFKVIMRGTSLDLINVHHPLPAISIIFSTGSRNIPKVYTFHSPWDLEYKMDKDVHAYHLAGQLWNRISSIIRKLTEKKSLMKCEKIVVESKYMKELLQTIHPVPRSKIEIIPGGVDERRFRPTEDRSSIRDELSIPQNKVVLLTIRRLVPRMGFQNLIKAISLIVKERKDVYLIIGGKGPLEGSLKELTNSLELEKYIRFVGFVEPEQLPLYYQAADLFILPTLELEGFGLVTLEALSSGTPVLGTPVGGTKEILGKLDKGLLFKNTSPESIANLVLSHLKNRENLLALKPKCRKFVEANYSWDRSVSSIEEVFYQITK